MQDRICSPLQFLQRTDALALARSCLLKDLPEIIGISERSLFGYRAGKYPVTAKALRKLQAAEAATGISASQWKADDPATVNEDTPAYGAKATRREAGERSIMERLEILESDNAAMKASIARLTEIIEGK